MNANESNNQRMKEEMEQVGQKYDNLRTNYSQLLNSFDQSEELRKVYK